MYQDLLTQLEALTDACEGLPETQRDTEALLRVQLANALAEARNILRALAADELLEGK
jgi:hypothetical protein